MRSTNSYGNDGKSIRKFLRENGIKPNVANVERIQREVVRSQSENERVERIAKERGEKKLTDPRTGADVMAQRKRMVQRELERRQR